MHPYWTDDLEGSEFILARMEWLPVLSHRRRYLERPATGILVPGFVGEMRGVMNYSIGFRSIS